MAPFYFEEELFFLITGLLGSIPSMLLSIATYVLTALAIYTIAQRRGLRKPWLAWIPVVNCWLLGSLSDQYRYVVKCQNTSRRKVLLLLKLMTVALSAAVAVLVLAIVVQLGFGVRMDDIFGLVLGILGCALPLAGVAIAFTVVRYMALFDIYRSLDPDNSVLFLVLSILFGITEPFFLFFNRNKDNGMPPRKQEPVYTQPQTEYPEETAYQDAPQEFWEQEDKNYL